MPLIIAWILEKIGSKVVLVGVQFAGSTAYVVAHVAILVLLYKIMKFIYDQYNSFMQFATNIQGSSELLDMALIFLHTIGFINASNDVFAIFSRYIVLFLQYKIGMFLFAKLHSLSNEFFKIGVLWQQ